MRTAQTEEVEVAVSQDCAICTPAWVTEQDCLKKKGVVPEPQTSSRSRFQLKVQGKWVRLWYLNGKRVV